VAGSCCTLEWESVQFIMPDRLFEH
jgi:hypothetical protein